MDLRDSEHYMKGERTYFKNGARTGGVNKLNEYAARNFYEIRQLKQIIEEKCIEADKVLEIGCGYGRLTPWLQEFTEAEQAVGIDHDREGIEKAKAQYPDNSFEWKVIGAEEISEELEEEFDIILSWTVMQHLSEELMQKAAEGIKKVLSENGYLIIAEESKKYGAEHMWGRSLEEYSKLFENLELISSKGRELEPSYGNFSEGGSVMVFKNKAESDES